MKKTLQPEIMGRGPAVKKAGSAAVPFVGGDKEQFIRGVFVVDPKKGLELLFREYYQPLCSHAMRFVFSSEQAKDLVGDVFYNFLHREHYKRVENSFRFYLYRSVRNECLNYLRDELGRTLYNLEEADLPEANQTETPETMMGYEELSGQIENAITHLPPQSQKVFMMNRYEGKKQQEIADELEISLKTVEAHITKSLKIIRRAIQGDWP